MDRFVDVVLVKIEYGKDKIGQQEKTGETTRTLTGNLFSISRQEWQVAAQAGLNPECMVLLRDREDYEGERVAELDGVRYEIYRTYMTNSDGIELYLRRVIGVDV